MGLFGKSDKEQEAEQLAAQHEAQRKMQEALQRRQQQEAAAKPAAAPAPPSAAAAPAPAPAPGAPKPQAVPVSRPAGADGETYTVQKGDSLSKIAKHHLGDANAWRKIYDANKSVIGDNPDKIFPGQKLKIPGGGARNA
jgi:nucleoid-associated protein YgaU